MIRNKVLAGALTTILLSGCGSSFSEGATTDGGSSAPTVSLNSIHVIGPALEGQVTVSDSTGKVLARQPLVGSGPVEFRGNVSPPLLVSFTSDQSSDLGAGSATFLARTSAHLEDGEIVALDPITTLITLLDDKRQDLDREGAAARVYRVLELDPSMSPEHPFEASDFDDDLFFQDAREAGGVDKLLSQLLTETEANSAATHPFVGVGSRSLVSTLLKEVAKGALKYGGKRAAGWLWTGMGFSSDEETVQQLIEDLNRKIDDLSLQVTAGNNLVQYTTLKSNFDKYANRIKDTHIKIELALGNPSRPDNTSIAALMTEIDSEKELVEALELLDAQSTIKGMSQLYLDGMSTRKHPNAGESYIPFFVKEFYPIYTSHFDRSASVQALLLELLAERFHYSTSFDDKPQLIELEFAIDRVQRFLKEQQNLLPLPVTDPEHVLLDPRTGLLWARQPYRVTFASMPKFIHDFELAGYKGWRHASGDDVFGLFDSIHKRAVDQHQNVHITLAGFLPDVAGRTFAEAPDLGAWNHSIFTSNAGYSVLDQGPVPDVYDTLLRISMLNLRYDETRMYDKDKVGNRRYFVYQIMMCCNAPEVVSLTVTANGRDDIKHQARFKATAKLSDNTERDMTDQVVWQLTDQSGKELPVDSLFRARVSNDGENAGVVTFRRYTDPIYITASYQTLGKPKRVSAPVNTGQTDLPDPPASDIVLYPTSLELPSTRPASARLGALRILENGRVFSESEDKVTWSSSSPLLSVDPAGRLTANGPAPNSDTAVTISAQLIANPNIKGEAQVLLRR